MALRAPLILCSDLRFERSLAYVTVRASKTIQFQERTFSLPLPRVPGSLLCPVTSRQPPLFSLLGQPVNCDLLLTRNLVPL